MTNAKKPALFLDRDGVINVNHGYVYKADDIEFIPGVFALIRRFVAAGFQPVIVTNQSGIARGMYSHEDFHQVMAYIQRQFSAKGIAEVPYYYCPHHPQYDTLENPCGCRKPAPGMLIAASDELNIDLGRSVMVGDKVIDIIAATAAGVARPILYDLAGEQRGQLHEHEQLRRVMSQIEVIDDLNLLQPL
ncbi:HAD family hydrolase [Alteromonas sp. ASW11-36]|uniref:D,D-heptose 1,7-bisphosphate phosphatase n=1 Tax=Alteromonas arenosi TaxID=3055817 RepID=A0ABT7SXW3_9ALTE|nr:HAD family hydrolase [Alteromonas sp. ASW11-36]MDM7861023.1 HAD family hydrolase [Alteromonas sp. ASW11-36]